MRLICVLSVVFALGVTPAYADDLEPAYTPRIVPQCKIPKGPNGKDITTITGEKVCAFTLTEWGLVLEADAELYSIRILLVEEKKRTAALELQVNSFREQASVYASNQTLLVNRNTQLTNDLIDLDKKYQIERVKPRWGSPLAWTVAAVSTSVLAGFVVDRLID